MSTVNPEDLLPFDPEIERTILAARRVVSLSRGINIELDIELEHSDCVHSVDLSDCVCVSDSTSDSLVVFTDSSSNFANSEIMADQVDRPTLKELATPDVGNQNLYIQYPELAANFELKSGLIHLLPKFHGLAGECPHKHLKEFHVVCSTMKPQAIDEDQI
ncbi:hypothetical protein QN277_000855 [Acacia crassicarpa]|uniref:Uncharacterized protein n=1 Tax=Acacia crassicarpa TaxID=499986 RepID=A0AAE1N680_9FABA|nr:hypothetical protein QN277_000855 [Acacia crassicarpa]